MRLAPVPTTSLARFQGWLPGRVMLPVGFAAILALGVYAVGTGRHGAEGETAQAAPPSDVVRVISAASDDTPAPARAGHQKDDAPAPSLVMAIDPGAVYRPRAEHAAGAARTATHAGEDMTIPAGVERFDTCGPGCDSRDPLVLHSSYPVRVAPAQVAPAEFATTQAAPQAARPAEADDDGLFDLPSLPAPGEVYDRAVEGTSAVYDTLKQAVGGVVQRFR
ncbi:hypothetical protein NVS89_21255 [Ancylobacter sp. MQZ15Z-1]|uniref:Uncharacterized protein n=1 Tax=Ancylobacter mangrovi TaxID=2972472 RepID=A0A9X2PPV9_9HYPH|nr:hypothetical protein [Ancylobacter mangrovi]MCS0497623.1 hypothetical protein [Ancylobacter mangrovi]